MQNNELVTEQKGCVGVITLNRPEALNALSLEMIRLITGVLTRWEKDDSVKAVLFYGAGERAFCAGGDIKLAYRMGMDYRRGEASENVVTLFFAEEYEFNCLLFHYPKPLIAFMDGITMGGGFGIAGPCKYRIATKNTVFAMPETGIGFYPDVGSIYFLRRCPGAAGIYLAVTGDSIGPGDTVYCGLATHYCPDVTADTVIGTLDKVLAGDGDIPEALESLNAAPEAGEVVQANRVLIDRCFDQDEIGDILSCLDADGGAWARKTAALIRTRAPTSLKVTLRHYRMAEGESFDDVITRDFRLTVRFMNGHDFYEGVRAAVIDKDRAPKWDPARLEDIDAADIDAYFTEQAAVSKAG